MDVPLPKMLLLAGGRRLDKELEIVHSQGEFTMNVIKDCGHVIHEDQSLEVAKKIRELLALN